MSIWTDRFANHPFLENLEQLKLHLERIKSLALEEVEGLEAFSRLESIASYLERAISNTDPELASIHPMNRANQSFPDLLSELTNFRETEEVGHLITANDHADSIVDHFALPLLLTQGDIDGVRDTIQSFRISAGMLIRNLENDASALVRRINE
ncbi:MAG: hypothetical protein IIB15_03630 [Chloroflexi bacterium]|nr:hypothetical protein [Chloroflexota bacterium]